MHPHEREVALSFRRRGGPWGSLALGQQRVRGDVVTGSSRPDSHASPQHGRGAQVCVVVMGSPRRLSPQPSRLSCGRATSVGPSLLLYPGRGDSGVWGYGPRPDQPGNEPRGAVESDTWVKVQGVLRDDDLSFVRNDLVQSRCLRRPV